MIKAKPPRLRRTTRTFWPAWPVALLPIFFHHTFITMDDTSSPSSTPAGPPQPRLSRATIIGSAVGGGVALIILLVLFYLIVRDRNYRNRGKDGDMPVEDQHGEDGLRPAPDPHKTQPQGRSKLSSRESTAVGSRDSSSRNLSLPKKAQG